MMKLQFRQLTTFLKNFYLQLQQTPKAPPVMTEDRIRNSKLPDAIKQLMLEHPIQQPQSYAPTLSDDLLKKRQD
jgi:hypothetical protein